MSNKLKDLANQFLDGGCTEDQFIGTISLIIDDLSGDDIVWLAKAIAERDLPANHRLLGAK